MNKKGVLKFIIRDVRKGFDSCEEIFENMKSWLSEEITEDWLMQTINDEYEKHLIQSKSWKKPTDTEKLYEVFKQLNEELIIALHNPAMGNSLSFSYVEDVESEWIDQGVKALGFCFYHDQALDLAVDPEEKYLMLNFGCLCKDHEACQTSINIAERIVDLLNSKGFLTTWNGTAFEKIKIDQIDWKNICHK